MWAREYACIGMGNLINKVVELKTVFPDLFTLYRMILGNICNCLITRFLKLKVFRSASSSITRVGRDYKKKKVSNSNNLLSPAST